MERPEATQARSGGSLNHSCDSNPWMADAVTLVARRDILAGEELTVDYALFTAGDGVLIEACRCGSPLCRRTVTGADWRLAEVQRQYYPHFSPLINRRIDQLKQKPR